MKLSQNQFKIFKKICKKYNIGIDTISINHLTFPSSKRSTRLRAVLKRHSDSIICKLLHNQLRHNTFWYNKQRHIRAKKRNRLKKELRSLVEENNNYKLTKQNTEKLAETEKWVKENQSKPVDLIDEDDEDQLIEYDPIDSNSSEPIKEEPIDTPDIEENEDLFELIADSPEQQTVSKAAPDSEVGGDNENDQNEATIVDRLLYKLKSEEKQGEILKEKIKIEESAKEVVKFNKPANPNQLPTPIVENSRKASVFLTEENEDEFKEKEKLAKILKMSSKMRLDDGKMMAKSEPPNLSCPERPRNMERARTVAEKRLLLSQKNDLRYHMIEQESKIYHQIQKKAKHNQINYNLLNCLLVTNVPIKKDPWRALTWLRTTEGNFIYKYAIVDDYELKMNGSVGNHRFKYIDKQTSKPLPKFRRISKNNKPCCKPIRISDRLKRSLVRNRRLQEILLSDENEDANTNPLRLNLEKKLAKVSPRPLSQKLQFINTHDMEAAGQERNDEDIFLGEYQNYEMPKVYLEVNLQPNKPVETEVKRYLKAILPHKCLDENWIEFALSTLKSNKKILLKDQKPEQPQVFRFNIPYENNKDSIVVRQIIKKNVDKDPLRMPPSDPNKEEESEDEMEWSFDKDADKDSELDKEIVEIIKDLTNSTFVNLNDNLFNRDEDMDERSLTPKFNILSQGNKKSDVNNISPKSRKQARLMQELRRLNCNIVRAEDENSLSNDSRCTNEYCLKGCVCDTSSDKFLVNMDEARSSYSMEEMESLHKRATAKMAKEEKDFRSTIIVTESNSLLVRTNETEKRRLKRAPKKYSDYLVPDDALDISSSRKREQSPVASTSNPKKKGEIKFTIHNIEKNEEEEEENKDQPVTKKLFSYLNLMEQKKKQKPRANNTSNINNKQTNWRDDSRMEKEINKMLHVNVTLRKLSNLYDIEPWCMVHHLYKCMCNLKATQGHPLEYNDFMNGGEEKSSKTANRKRKSETNDHDLSPKKKTTEEPPLVIDEVSGQGLQIQNIISLNPLQEDDDKSSRCAPVNTPFYKTKNSHTPLDKEKKGVLFRDFHGERRIEILNLDELLSENKGPIFINIYDCRLNRLNDVMRRLILNDNAIIYIDGTSYYVDKSTGVDVTKIEFDSLYDNIEHPIFILQKKGDGNSTIEDGDQLPRDFIKLMHDESSVIVEKNKTVMKEISTIIDNVLKNVRKKMAKKVSTASNGFHDGYVREQLEKISRKRTTSCSSLSSASSPFYLDTPSEQSVRAQQMGPTQEFNNLFTARMRKFLDILRSNTLGLEPSDQLINKFYLYRWDVFLRSFAQGLSEVWLVTINNSEGTPHFMMALTRKDTPPPIENVPPRNIKNIRNLQPLDPKYPEFVKLVLLRVQNIMTKHMVVLLYGCKDYFRICGSLNTPVDYKACGFVARPNPRSHPELAKKIINVYNVWRSVKESNPEANKSLALPSPRAPPKNHVAKRNNKDENPGLSNRKVVINPLYRFKEKQSAQQVKEKFYIAVKMTNDFSDLYIKGWNKYLSYNVIMRTLSKAKQHTGVLLMKPSSDDSCKLTAYAIGKKLDCLKASSVQESNHDTLLFGPYDKKLDSELTLMQNVDGKLMTRDFYEHKTNIIRKVRTTIEWVSLDPLALKKETTAPSNPTPSSSNSAASTSNSAPHTQTSRQIDKLDPKGFVSLHSFSNSNSNPSKLKIKVAPFAKMAKTTSSASSSGTSTPTSSFGLKISSIVGNYQEYQNDQTETVRKIQISNVSQAATLTNGRARTGGNLNKDLNKYQNQPWTSIPDDFLDPDFIKSEPNSEDDMEMNEA